MLFNQSEYGSLETLCCSTNPNMGRWKITVFGNFANVALLSFIYERVHKRYVTKIKHPNKNPINSLLLNSLKQKSYIIFLVLLWTC